MVNQSACTLAEMLMEHEIVILEVWGQLYSFWHKNFWSTGDLNSRSSHKGLQFYSEMGILKLEDKIRDKIL